MVLIFTALVATTPSNYLSIPPTIIITFRDKYSISSAISTISAFKAGNITIITIIIIKKKIISILALYTVPISSVPEARSFLTPYNSGDNIIIAIINIYSKPLSLSFTSNIGGPSSVGSLTATILSYNTFT